MVWVRLQGELVVTGLTPLGPSSSACTCCLRHGGQCVCSKVRFLRFSLAPDGRVCEVIVVRLKFSWLGWVFSVMNLVEVLRYDDFCFLVLLLLHCFLILYGG